jgi:hypothetical protein
MVAFLVTLTAHPHPELSLVHALPQIEPIKGRVDKPGPFDKKPCYGDGSTVTFT